MHDAASRQSIGRSFVSFFLCFWWKGDQRKAFQKFGPLIRPPGHVNPCRVPLCQINFCGV